MPFESHVKRVRVDLSAVTRQATQLRCGCRRAGRPVVVELISVPLLLVLILEHLGRFAVVFVELLEGFLELAARACSDDEALGTLRGALIGLDRDGTFMVTTFSRIDVATTDDRLLRALDIVAERGWVPDDPAPWWLEPVLWTNPEDVDWNDDE